MSFRRRTKFLFIWLLLELSSFPISLDGSFFTPDWKRSASFYYIFCFILHLMAFRSPIRPYIILSGVDLGNIKKDLKRFLKALTISIFFVYLLRTSRAPINLKWGAISILNRFELNFGWALILNGSRVLSRCIALRSSSLMCESGFRQ